MTSDDARIRDDVHLEVTNEDDRRKHKKAAKKAASTQARPQPEDEPAPVLDKSEPNVRPAEDPRGPIVGEDRPEGESAAPADAPEARPDVTAANLQPGIVEPDVPQPEPVAATESDETPVVDGTVVNTQPPQAKTVITNQDEKEEAQAEGEPDGDGVIAISEATWTAQDGGLIIDRPQDWATQDYQHKPPPPVLFERPFDSI